MRPPVYWWAARFLQYAIILSVALAFCAALVIGLWPPFYLWLANDEWHWTPFNRWLRYVALGGMVGVVMGAWLTNYEWLIQTPAGMLRKICVTSLVVGISISVTALVREHLNQVLSG